MITKKNIFWYINSILIVSWVFYFSSFYKLYSDISFYLNFEKAPFLIIIDVFNSYKEQCLLFLILATLLITISTFSFLFFILLEKVKINIKWIVSFLVAVLPVVFLLSNVLWPVTLVIVIVVFSVTYVCYVVIDSVYYQEQYDFTNNERIKIIGPFETVSEGENAINKFNKQWQADFNENNYKIDYSIVNKQERIFFEIYVREI